MHHRPFTTSLALLALGSLASAQETSFPTYSAETYGSVSGDVPMRGLGLVLELVDGATPAPKLRLFGGVPGQAASILLGRAPAHVDGPRGMTQLVDGPAFTFRGTFDWLGYYEVPLPGSLDPGVSIYAQGVHTGVLELAPGGGPLVQLSNGLQVTGDPDEDTTLSFDELLPHLPEDVEDLPLTATLAERLQAYLNSAGDATKIKLHVEGSGGYFGNGGAEGEVELAIERSADGFYELRMSSDLAATVGVEVAEGLEASAKAGVGMSRVFRFHSAPGVARGLLGVLAAVRYPNLTPGRWLAESGLLGDPAEHVARLKAAVDFAQQHADEAEAFLWNVLATAQQDAEARRDQALPPLRDALRRLAAAAWYARPACLARVAACAARFASAAAQAELCAAARTRGEQALAFAKGVVEKHREELRAALALVARGPRIASALLQLRGYAADHYVGSELRAKQSAGAELSIPLPVKVVGLGAGVERELEMTVSVLFEQPTEHTPRRIVVTRQLEDDATVAASFIAGGEYERKHTGKVVETFELGADEGFHKTMAVQLERDVQARGFLGRLVAVGTGIGRKTSVSLERDLTIGPDFELGAFLLGEGRDTLGETEVGFELQDRRVRTVECDFIVSIAGNGGGFELDIEWTDQGRLLSRQQTIREALGSIFDAADQIPDSERGAVVLN